MKNHIRLNHEITRSFPHPHKTPNHQRFPSEMTDTGTPPVIPVQFQQYKLRSQFSRIPSTKPLNLRLSSYVVDPQWQHKFTIIWPTVLSFFVLLSLPHLIRSIRNGQAYSTIFGIWEDYARRGYATIVQPMHETERKRTTSLLGGVENLVKRFGSLFYWTLPGFGLNAGQRWSFIFSRKLNIS